MGPDVESGAPQTGLHDAFARYRKKIARMLARIVKPCDVEDIVQETYVRIYQAAQNGPIHHPESFMLHAARNLALNHIGRADALNYVSSRGNEEISNAEEGGAAEPALLSEPLEATVQAEEEFLIFCRAIRELPLQCRRAFILRKVYGLSQREAAQQLEISEGTVEKHIARGIVACSVYMTRHGYARQKTPTPRARKRIGE